MAGLILPNRRIALPVKPAPGAVLDRSHPLAHGLRVLLPFSANGGRVDGNAARPSERLNLANTTWAATPRGTAASFDGTTSSGVTDKSIDLTGTTAITVAVLVRMSSSDSGTRIIAEHSSHYFADDSWAVLSENGIVKGYSVLNVGAANVNGAASAVSGTYLFTFTFASVITPYIDGAQSGTVSASFTPVAYKNQALRVGARNSASLFFSGPIGGIWIWTRVLAPAEIKDHAAAPFAMLDQPARWFAGVDAAGGPTIIAVPLATASGAGLAPTVRAAALAPVGAAAGSGLAPSFAMPTPAAAASGAGSLPSFALGTPAGAAAGVGAAPAFALQAPAGSGSGAGLAPTVRTTVAPPLGTGSGGGFIPAVALNVPLGAGSASGPVPTVRVIVGPPVGTATGTGFAVTVVGPGAAGTFSVDLATASGAGFAPTLRAVASPPVGAASAAGLAPTVVTRFPVVLATASGQAFAPGLMLGMPTGGVAGTGAAPVLRAIVSAALAQATAAGFVPDLLLGQAVYATTPGWGTAADLIAAWDTPTDPIAAWDDADLLVASWRDES